MRSLSRCVLDGSVEEKKIITSHGVLDGSVFEA